MNTFVIEHEQKLQMLRAPFPSVCQKTAVILNTGGLASQSKTTQLGDALEKEGFGIVSEVTGGSVLKTIKLVIEDHNENILQGDFDSSAIFVYFCGQEVINSQEEPCLLVPSEDKPVPVSDVQNAIRQGQNCAGFIFLDCHGETSSINSLPYIQDTVVIHASNPDLSTRLADKFLAALDTGVSLFNDICSLLRNQFDAESFKVIGDLRGPFHFIADPFVNELLSQNSDPFVKTITDKQLAPSINIAIEPKHTDVSFTEPNSLKNEAQDPDLAVVEATTPSGASISFDSGRPGSTILKDVTSLPPTLRQFILLLFSAASLLGSSNPNIIATIYLCNLLVGTMIKVMSTTPEIEILSCQSQSSIGIIHYREGANVFVNVYNLQEGSTPLPFKTISCNDSTTILLDDDLVYIGYGSGRIEIWCEKDQEYVIKHRLSRSHTGKITCMAVSPNRKSLVSCANDNRMILWNLASGQSVDFKRLNSSGNQPPLLSFSEVIWLKSDELITVAECNNRVFALVWYISSLEHDIGIFNHTGTTESLALWKDDIWYHIDKQQHLQFRRGKAVITSEIDLPASNTPVLRVTSIPNVITRFFKDSSAFVLVNGLDYAWHFVPERLQGYKHSIKPYLDNFASKNVSWWLTKDVVEWLEQSELSCHAESFQDNLIDGQLLLCLNDDDLQNDLGITKPLHRKRIFLEIGKLTRQPQDESSLDPDTPPVGSVLGLGLNNGGTL